MDITPAAAAATIVAPIDFQNGSGLTPQAAASAAPTATAGGLGATVVELSGLGQLLSATATFQNNLAVLQPGSANSGLGQNFGTDFASFAAEVQSFVDTYNGLSNSLAGLQAPGGPLAGEPLAAQFSQALAAQAAAPLNDAGSAPNSLPQLGITLQASATPGAPGTLAVDLQALQSAFAGNPSGAFSLLGQATQAFGNLAAGFASHAGGASAALGDLASLDVGLTGLAQPDLAAVLALTSLNQPSVVGSGLPFLFESGLIGSGSVGLADLLLAQQAAVPGSQTGAPTLSQQLLALNQYTLVSSLLSA